MREGEGRLRKQAISGIMLALLFTGMLVTIFDIMPVKGDWVSTIYIRANGLVDPPTAPLLHDGDVYTLTDNIITSWDGIVIERDNMTLNGAGYLVQGPGDIGSKGIGLTDRHNVTVKNMEVKGFHYGILLYSSSNNTIFGNSIADNRLGVVLSSGSSNNHVVGNTFAGDGLHILASYGNVAEGNIVNGKPLVYLENVSDQSVADAGQVVLVNCNNIRVENLNLSSSSVGVELLDTNNAKIANNTIAGNFFGIHFINSSNNTVSASNLTANIEDGIALRGFSNNNSISRNNFEYNAKGIETSQALNNSIVGNNIRANTGPGIYLGENSIDNRVIGNNLTSNGYGIYLFYALSNLVYHNNFMNSNQIFTYNSANVWDDRYPLAGNYWGDYAGEDANGDGIGDKPYVIYGDEWDHYPLMRPWSPLPIHDVNTGSGYGTIQEAIDANETLDGHRIFVEAGTYNENIIVNKSLTLIGESKETTTINGTTLGTVLNVTANQVAISNFTIQNSGSTSLDSGIELYSTSYCNITENIVTKNNHGILLYHSTNNTISRNTIVANNGSAIEFIWSSNNTAFRNKIRDNDESGLLLTIDPSNNTLCSDNNTIRRNEIVNNYDGISLELSSGNSVYENTLGLNSRCGLFVYNSSGSLIHHNNFANNTTQVLTENSANAWDDGYPSGGNYWTDHNGTDLFSGPYQNLTGSDGIGDTALVINASNQDQYPLMNPWSNIAVWGVVPSKTMVIQGDTLSIKVTVENQGYFTEIFNVTIYANLDPIQTQDTALASGSITTLTFNWNTWGFSYGNNTLSAYAWSVIGETDMTDNVLIGQAVRVLIPGDINRDGVVDSADLGILGMAWGAFRGDSNYRADADLDHNDVVDSTDLGILGAHWGDME